MIFNKSLNLWKSKSLSVWLFATPWRTAQARILEWVAIFFCRGSSQPRDWAQVSQIAGRFFTSWATREAHLTFGLQIILIKETVGPENRLWAFPFQNSIILGWKFHLCLRIEFPQNKLFYSLPGVRFSALPKWHFIMKTHLKNSFWVPTATLWGENENTYLPQTYQR